MLSEEVLLRLSALNRTRLPAADRGPPPSVDAPGDRPAAADALAHADFEQLAPEPAEGDVAQLPAGSEIVNPWGKHWLRARSLSQLWPHGDEWLSRERVRLDHLAGKRARRSAELQALLDQLPTGVLFLDLETCGFAGSPVFLAGLIHEQAGEWVLTQLLARTYAEEKPLLQTLWNVAARKRVLVTFNGKSFDWPMVHDRSTVHHLGHDGRAEDARPTAEPFEREVPARLQRDDPRPVLLHCDLLHHARRKWGKRLPDCRLQTLERHLCRRHRAEDIPGREIPAAYHDFVRSGDAWLLRSVLHHNALDLITLLQIAMLAVQ